MSTNNEHSAVARLGAESLRQTKDGLKKSAKTPAVLDFNTQSHGLALEGTHAKIEPSRHTESGMHPHPTKNETHTLALDLNRGMTAGMDRVDVNAHLDGTGISHGTNQGLMRVNGRDRWTSQARLETQERKAHGNSMETPRVNDKLTLEQSAEGINEIIHKDSKLTKLKLNPHKKKRHHRISNEKRRIRSGKRKRSQIQPD